MEFPTQSIVELNVMLLFKGCLGENRLAFLISRQNVKDEFVLKAIFQPSSPLKVVLNMVHPFYLFNIIIDMIMKVTLPSCENSGANSDSNRMADGVVPLSEDLGNLRSFSWSSE